MDMNDDSLDYNYYEPNRLAPTLEPGEAAFAIIKCEPRRGKKEPHHKQLHIVMKVTDSRGGVLNVDEYLVATVGDEPGMKRLATKIRDIANAINKPELYAPNRKLTPRDLVGGKGNCIIKTQVSDNYADKTVVSKYISALDQQENPDDESIPF